MMTRANETIPVLTQYDSCQICSKLVTTVWHVPTGSETVRCLLGFEINNGIGVFTGCRVICLFAVQSKTYITINHMHFASANTLGNQHMHL